MRYVLKNKETGQFLGNGGEWTRFLGEAQTFPNGLSINLHLENAPSVSSADMQIIELPRN